MPSSLRSNTHSEPAGRSPVSTAFIGLTNAGRTSAASRTPGKRRRPWLHAHERATIGARRLASGRYGVGSVAAPAPRTHAPAFALPSTTGGSVGLDELVSSGPA